MILISKNPEANWKNNEIQFPRLIAEIKAAGVFHSDTFVDRICISMNIDREDLEELIDRACAQWDEIEKHQP